MISLQSWTNLSWKNFEYLSLEIAQETIRTIDFSIYLKQGHDQEGIDIKSSLSTTGKYICIQCKKVLKLTSTDLENIVDEFLSKDFAKNSERFILSTSADLQEPKLQKLLRKLEKKLKKDYGILFEQWDIYGISEKLRRQYGLVQFYFSETDADNHCYQRENIIIKAKNIPQKDYIERKIRSFKDQPSANLYPWYIETRDSVKLEDLFNQENRYSKQLICIVADAHQGKSILLKQTAYLLEQIKIPFTSLFVELKSQIVQPISDILTSEYNLWKQIPAKDLVIFIDGLDEVPTDKFDEAVKHIRDFSKQNPRTSIIFSCRKIFYSHYRIKEIISAFTFYELNHIGEDKIIEFLVGQIGERYSKFMRFVQKAKLSSLLHEPFYLVALVKLFNGSSGLMPRTKVKVIERVIAESFSHNEDRRLRHGRILHQQSKKFTEIAQRFAFALQLAGTNSIMNNDIQSLFSDNEIELLEHNSLITIHNNLWSFSNAIFQEHLSAMVLLRFSFDEIISFSTVGKKLKKVKIKWLETLSSYLFLEDDSNLKNKLIRFLENDNIELLFKTEHSKYEPDFKFNILKRLFKRLNEYNISPMVIDEGSIASFIENVLQCIEFLNQIIRSSSYSIIVKITSVRVLKELELSPSQKEKILMTVKHQLKISEDAFYINQMLELLAGHKLGDKQLLEKLIANVQLNQYHDYRDGVYQLIIALDSADAFCEYIIDGIPALIKHNEHITRYGSEHSFEEALTKVKSIKSFRLIFNAFRSEKWLNFYRYSHARQDLLKKIFSNAAEVFRINPLIIFPVIEFIKAIGRHYLREDYIEVDKFFEENNVGWLTMRLEAVNILKNEDWELGALLTEDSVSYFLFEYEESFVDKTVLLSVYNALRRKNKRNFADTFFSLANSACEGGLVKLNEPDDSLIRYTELQNRRYVNDMYYIQSNENFRQGVIKYFEAYGKKSIPESDLYVDEESKYDRQNYDSIFINRFLLAWIRRNGMIFLKDALAFIDNTQKFIYFRNEEILNYHPKNKDDQLTLDNIIKQYYDSVIKDAKFENCRWDVSSNGNSNEHYLTKEEQLGRIFERYQFPTTHEQLMEMVWLDVSGINAFENNSIKNRKPLTQLILNQLDDDERHTFSDIVLRNINKGIKTKRVLATHIGLCKYLKIWDANSFLLDLILNDQCDGLGLTDLTDIYLELNGDTYSLIPVFNRLLDFNSYEYLHYIKIMITNHSSVVKKSLLNCLKSPKSADNVKSLAAAYLCSLGDKRGFLFLVEFVRQNKVSPFTTHSPVKISSIDTGFALTQLEDIAYLLVEPDNKKMRRSESAKQVLLEWLNDFAAKSENDLELVVQFLFKKQMELKGLFTYHYHLYWDAFRIIENFRNNDKEVKTVSQIKAIFQVLKN
jgi:hypothetical protein